MPCAAILASIAADLPSPGPEERSDRARIAERLADRCDALIEVGLLVGDGPLPNLRRVGLRVGRDGVAVVISAAHERRKLGCHFPDHEERRLHALRGEDVEHPVGARRQRTVVERQDDLVIPERQGLGILHRADAAVLGRVDRDDPAGPECVGFAVAVRRHRIGVRRDEGEQERGGDRPRHDEVSHCVETALASRTQWQSIASLPPTIRHRWEGLPPARAAPRAKKSPRRAGA